MSIFCFMISGTVVAKSYCSLLLLLQPFTPSIPEHLHPTLLDIGLKGIRLTVQTRLRLVHFYSSYIRISLEKIADRGA